MKTEIVPSLARSVVLVTLCLATLNTWARPPRAREACGVLQNINVEARTLTLAPEKGERPLVVAWKRDTKFLKNWNFESANALNQGGRARVFYHSPFFGKPFVTKVIWTNGQPSQTNERQKL